jgi:surface polysaccharide O-acyltransferase-like enzyme
VLFAPRPAVLLVLAVAIALLAWWGCRQAAPSFDSLRWMLTGLVLVMLAMALLLLTVPAPSLENALRATVFAEAAISFWLLWRRGRESGRG